MRSFSPIVRVRKLIWNFYAELKIDRANPSKIRRLVLRARFDRIFRRRTGFATLDRLLKRLHANKAELLMVLERPEIPLHTNGSENDIRCQVTRRKVSAGTRSDAGRDCRDAFLGLAKTCAKHGVAFWDYLGSRPQSSRAACRSAPGGPCPLPRATGLIPTAARRFAGVTKTCSKQLIQFVYGTGFEPMTFRLSAYPIFSAFSAGYRNEFGKTPIYIRATLELSM
jgi:Transposase IS66 family